MRTRLQGFWPECEIYFITTLRVTGTSHSSSTDCLYSSFGGVGSAGSRADCAISLPQKQLTPELASIESAGEVSCSLHGVWITAAWKWMDMCLCMLVSLQAQGFFSNRQVVSMTSNTVSPYVSHSY